MPNYEKVEELALEFMNSKIEEEKKNKIVVELLEEIINKGIDLH